MFETTCGIILCLLDYFSIAFVCAIYESAIVENDVRIAGFLLIGFVMIRIIRIAVELATIMRLSGEIEELKKQITQLKNKEK